MQVKCAVYTWHTGNTAAVFAGYLFPINEGAVLLERSDCEERNL